MWQIQMQWNDVWVTIAYDFKSREDAELAFGAWKMKFECYGDPFRAVPLTQD